MPEGAGGPRESRQPAGSPASDCPHDFRARLTAATIAVVAERGYRKTTVDAVLTAAHVPAPVFDEHFEGLADCFLAGIEETLTSVERLVLRHFSREAQWPQRVRRSLRSLLNAIAANPEVARATIIETFRAEASARARYRRTLEVFAPLLEAGNDFTTQPGGALGWSADALIGGIAAIIHRYVFEDRAAELPRSLEALTFFALMPFLGNEEASRVAAGG